MPTSLAERERPGEWLYRFPRLRNLKADRLRVQSAMMDANMSSLRSNLPYHVKS